MNEINKIKISQRLKTIRKGLGLTQEEFAIKVGSTRSMIAQIELAKSFPTLDFAINVINKCEISYKYLIYGDDELDNSIKLKDDNNRLKNEVRLQKEIIEYQNQLIKELKKYQK